MVRSGSQLQRNVTQREETHRVDHSHQLLSNATEFEDVVASEGQKIGTAIACIAQLGGVSAEDAVEWTREAYERRAVETPWQRRYVRRFASAERSAW